MLRRAGPRLLPLLALALLPARLRAQDATAEGSLTTTWIPGTLLPDRFECETFSCAKWNPWEWYPVDFPNSTVICQEVQDDLTKGFAVYAPDMCRRLKEANLPYENCKKDYCQMFDDAVKKLVHLEGPGYYGRDTCEPFLDFNRSLCEKEYRDAQVFCDCFCPMMPLFDPIPGCEEEVMHFLVLGKRSAILAEKYPMSPLCAADMCRWFELIGNPLPPNPVDIAYGVPNICHVSGLPFKPKQCERQVTTVGASVGMGKNVQIPYEPCPWHEPTKEDDLMECTDKTTHTINPLEADSWAVCAERNFRWTCPKNFPVMCEDLDCDGSADYCCQTRVDRCKTGEERMCPPMLMSDLGEWHGLLTPGATVSRGTTTTLDPLDAFLMRTLVTTTAASVATQYEALPMPLIITASVGGAFVCILAICAFIFKEHFTVMAHSLVGAPRLLKAVWSDPIHVFTASPPPDIHPALPPLKSAAQLEKERLDDQANTALRSGVDAAFQRGFRGLCAYHGCPPPAEEDTLIWAMDAVRSRGLDLMGENPILLKRAETWLRTLHAERGLLKASAQARPELLIVGNRQNLQGLPGKPWLSTLEGQTCEGEIRDLAWSNIEALSEAIKTAKEASAQENLLKNNKALLGELIARTRELPADRCVLDPEGDGLKLLPKGHQRAIKGFTGESYLYHKETRLAGDVDEAPPPSELLDDVATDAARPVCADYAAGRKCRGGRRCPWRHQKPQPGDAMRECILRNEDDR